MARVEDNQAMWSSANHDWSSAGDEWSEAWGGPLAQWEGTILPRIEAFLPAATVLEIAPGFGRWTQFLKDRCERLIAVDLVDDCAEACRKRFAGSPHVEVHVNDGRTLPMVEDHSVDFAFSFDSLVHADLGVLISYLGELARTLREDRVAFLHHSNLGQHERTFALIDRLPHALRKQVIRRLDLGRRHWRDPGVTAAKVAIACRPLGLACIRQERVNWGSRATIDCLTTLTRVDSARCRPNRVSTNRAFMDEARRVRLAAEALDAISGPTHFA